MNGFSPRPAQRPRGARAACALGLLGAAASLLPGLAHAQAAERSVTDLGSLGGAGTQVESINEAGTVTGMSQDARVTRNARDLRGSWQAFVKRLDQPMIDLFEINGVSPQLINADELVVGTRFSSIGSSYASFRWREGTEIENLPKPAAAGNFGRPSDLDEAGNILLNMGGQAFLWKASGEGFVALACPAGDQCEATAMNERGAIVGVAVAPFDAAAPSQRERPLLWASATAEPTDLPSDPEHSVRPVDINDQGTIVGIYTASEARNAVFWAGAEHALRNLGGGVPSALNNHDFAVGRSEAPDGGFFGTRPVLWDLRSGVRTDLPLSVAGGTGGALHDINDAGLIVGTTYNARGTSLGALYRGYALPR